MRLEHRPGSLRIASSNAEQEEAKEELEIDYAGDAIEIGFNVTYLIDVLANASAEMVKIELQDANSSALISVPDLEGFKYGDADEDLSLGRSDPSSRCIVGHPRPARWGVPVACRHRRRAGRKLLKAVCDE